MSSPNPPLPPLPTITLGRYRHYKGGDYEVTGVVRHSESLEPMVLYRPLHHASGSWVRPLSMFLETVAHEGRRLPRFTFVGPVHADEVQERLQQQPDADPGARVGGSGA
jgi:hypothetical protein